MNSFDNCNNPSSKHKHKIKSKPNGLRCPLALHVGAGSSHVFGMSIFCSKKPHAVSASWNGTLFIDRKSCSLQRPDSLAPCLAKSTYTTSK
jgi:hypothetical protein